MITRRKIKNDIELIQNALTRMSWAALSITTYPQLLPVCTWRGVMRVEVKFRRKQNSQINENIYFMSQFMGNTHKDLESSRPLNLSTFGGPWHCWMLHLQLCPPLYHSCLLPYLPTDYTIMLSVSICAYKFKCTQFFEMTFPVCMYMYASAQQTNCLNKSTVRPINLSQYFRKDHQHAPCSANDTPLPKITN